MDVLNTRGNVGREHCQNSAGQITWRNFKFACSNLEMFNQLEEIGNAKITRPLQVSSIQFWQTENSKYENIKVR